MSSQSDLFAPLDKCEKIVLSEGCCLRLYKGWLATEVCQAAYDRLLAEIDWQQPNIHVYGRRLPIPRLQAWYGDPHAVMAYSGTHFTPQQWYPLLTNIKTAVETESKATFNSVLVNLYRDGKDGVGWHADDEPELGYQPIIASLSLGATRLFSLKHKKIHSKAGFTPKTVRLPLNSGDLLVMYGNTQREWLHAVNKSKGVCQPRINLTFRRIVTPKT
jgi:alkylated DNA repair dioxygenase AlkB